MKQPIKSKTYRYRTSNWVVKIPCPFPPSSPRWHQTDMYRSHQGVFFLAGKGGSLSRWAKQTPHGAIPGQGIEPISKADALAYALKLGVSLDRFPRLGFVRADRL